MSEQHDDACHPPPHTPLLGLNYILFDVQTTGASPKAGHLIEIAWRSLNLGDINQEIDPFSALIQLPPGYKLPRTVQRLTGIKTKLLKSASQPVDVARDLWTLVEQTQSITEETPPSIWLAHVARFERSFIRALLLAHPPAHLSDREAILAVDHLPWLCTHAICQRCFPTLPRRTLSVMSGYFGGPQLTLKRALPHLEATESIWRGLLEHLNEEEITTWGTLQTLLTTPVKRQRFAPPLPRQIRLQAPTLPGVYYFKGRRNEILYVGSANNLKQRVNQHFRGQKGHEERHLELITLTSDVTWQTCASHLEALLLENREIKRLTPPYNRALTNQTAPFYLDLTQIHDQPDPDGKLGPWVNRSLIEAIGVAQRSLQGDFSLIHHPAWPGMGVEAWRTFANTLRSHLIPSSQELPSWEDWIKWGKELLCLEDSALTDLSRTTLTLRASEIAMLLVQEVRLAQWINMLATGELIWMGSLGGGQRGWRHLKLGIKHALESRHLSEAPEGNHLIQLNDPPVDLFTKLTSRTAYDEARITYRFICRAIKRGERVFWRQSELSQEHHASWQVLSSMVHNHALSRSTLLKTDELIQPDEMLLPSV